MTLIFALAFGLAFGSFANAAIDRIPRRQALSGHSQCDGCLRALRPFELVPLLSYAALRGRCATCQRAIGVRTPIVEALCGAVFLAAFASMRGYAAATASGTFVAILIGAGVLLMKRGARA